MRAFHTLLTFTLTPFDAQLSLLIPYSYRRHHHLRQSIEYNKKAGRCQKHHKEVQASTA